MKLTHRPPLNIMVLSFYDTCVTYEGVRDVFYVPAALEIEAQTGAWFPQAHEYKKWAKGIGSSPGKGPRSPCSLRSLDILGIGSEIRSQGRCVLCISLEDYFFWPLTLKDIDRLPPEFPKEASPKLDGEKAGSSTQAPVHVFTG